MPDPQKLVGEAAGMNEDLVAVGRQRARQDAASVELRPTPAEVFGRRDELGAEQCQAYAFGCDAGVHRASQLEMRHLPPRLRAAVEPHRATDADMDDATMVEHGGDSPFFGQLAQGCPLRLLRHFQVQQPPIDIQGVDTAVWRPREMRQLRVAQADHARLLAHDEEPAGASAIAGEGAIDRQWQVIARRPRICRRHVDRSPAVRRSRGRGRRRRRRSRRRRRRRRWARRQQQYRQQQCRQRCEQRRDRSLTRVHVVAVGDCPWPRRHRRQVFRFSVSRPLTKSIGGAISSDSREKNPCTPCRACKRRRAPVSSLTS